MRSRRLLRALGLAAALPLLVAAVAGVGYDRFRCAFTGEVSQVGTGCCPAEDPPATPVVSAASCCDLEHARPVRVPSESAARAATCPAPDLVAALPADFADPAPSPAALARNANAQAPPRPPLVLLKHALLI